MEAPVEYSTGPSPEAWLVHSMTAPAPATKAAAGAAAPALGGAPTGAGAVSAYEGDDSGDDDTASQDGARRGASPPSGEEVGESVGCSAASVASAATTDAALSSPASPHLEQPQQPQQQAAVVRKPISSHIAGTGTFIVMYNRPPTGTEARTAPPYLERPAGEQELMLQEAYGAVLAVCDAMVPEHGLELMDALMETTDVYRKRYGHKQDLFDLQKQPPQTQQQTQQQTQEQDGEGLVCLTPAFRSLGGGSNGGSVGGGSFWLAKDRYYRKRRSSFTQLARSQRARVIKATYELVQAVGEEFSPGTRLDLLDRVFKHHTALRPAREKERHHPAPHHHPHHHHHPAHKRARTTAAAAAAAETMGGMECATTHHQMHAAATAASLLAGPAAPGGYLVPTDPVVVAAAHILAAHWANALLCGTPGGGRGVGGGGQQQQQQQHQAPPSASSAQGAPIPPPPPPPVLMPSMPIALLPPTGAGTAAAAWPTLPFSLFLAGAAAPPTADAPPQHEQGHGQGQGPEAAGTEASVGQSSLSQLAAVAEAILP